jgi:hypothetical protein
MEEAIRKHADEQEIKRLQEIAEKEKAEADAAEAAAEVERQEQIRIQQ